MAAPHPQQEGAPITEAEALARLEATRVNLQGEPIAKSAAQSWQFFPQGPTKILLYFDRGNRRFPSDTTLVVLRDSAGEVLTLLRIQP